MAEVNEPRISRTAGRHRFSEFTTPNLPRVDCLADVAAADLLDLSLSGELVVEVSRDGGTSWGVWGGMGWDGSADWTGGRQPQCNIPAPPDGLLSRVTLMVLGGTTDIGTVVEWKN